MNRALPVALLVLAGLGLLFATSSLFEVDQTQQAIVLRFGAHRATVTDPGLHLKVPFIDTVVYYDKRLLGVDSPDEEITLGDQKRLVVDTYTRYRISDPLQFYKTMGNETNARAQLSNIVSSSVRRVMGKIKLPEILSPQRDAIMRKIEKDVAAEATSRGITVVDVRLRRADLPEQISQAIYKRMRSERERQAKQLRAQGYEWAQQIRARADRQRTVILAEAQQQAQILRGEGDADANRIYAKAFGQDPRFFDLYRSLEAYRTALGGKTTLVLSPNSDFFRFFDQGPGASARGRAAHTR
jgi:membrane protease subunit HflC